MGRAICLLAVLAATAWGQVSETAIVAPRRVGVGPSQRRLSLDEAVELTIKANLDVAMERTNLARADQAVEGAKAPFDPLFRWQPSFGNSNSPSVSLLQGSQGVVTQQSASQSVSFHQDTGWNGLAVDAAWRNSRTTIPGSPFVSLTPFYISQ